MWLTFLPGLPGKTNREMFNKPCSTDQIWEIRILLWKHGAMSLAKNANTVQDIIYEMFESQKDTQRSVTAVKQPYVKCSAQILLWDTALLRSHLGERHHLGIPGATKGFMVKMNPSGCLFCSDLLPNWVIQVWPKTSAGLCIYPFPR